MGPRILVTGALGQIGTELVEALEERHGHGNVIATDVREGGGCRILDVMDAEGILSLVSIEGITEIYHLAALLSATGERNPELCWKINVGGLENVILAARRMDAECSHLLQLQSLGLIVHPLRRRLHL